jgi:hypothetical protein
MNLYCRYYAGTRTYLSLDKDSPIPRPIAPARSALPDPDSTPRTLGGRIGWLAEDRSWRPDPPRFCHRPGGVHRPTQLQAPSGSSSPTPNAATWNYW